MDSEKYLPLREKQVPVCAEVDLCVVGGGVTGTFAAVRAARLGLRVALVERSACLGGMATNGHVNIWHSLYNTTGEKQIIAGLTYEVLQTMQRRGVTDRLGKLDDAAMFNTDELKFILDDLAVESGIRLFLHSMYAGVETDGDRVTAVLLCGKDGLRAIRAGFVVDATGDGDVARDLGFEGYHLDPVQPPTPAFLLQGDASDIDLGALYAAHADEFDLGDDFGTGWYQPYPYCEGITTRADIHVTGLNVERAEELTQAELVGRRKIRGMLELLRRYGKPGEAYNVLALCNGMGIRDSLHYPTRYRANEMDLLLGKAYEDTVLQGTYNIDIHCAYGDYIVFKRLDGVRHTLYPKEHRNVMGSWREECGIDEKEYPIATYYQVPFESLVGERYGNFIAAGRMLHADVGAFGALRVMVNLNQLGEAAGVAAYASLHQGKPLQALCGAEVRALLRQGGSAL